MADAIINPAAEQKAMRAEARNRLQQALDDMEEVDREVIALRHFEHLNSQETADVLGMSKSGASSRYTRAMERLRETLSQYPEFSDWR